MSEVYILTISCFSLTKSVSSEVSDLIERFESPSRQRLIDFVSTLEVKKRVKSKCCPFWKWTYPTSSISQSRRIPFEWRQLFIILLSFLTGKQASNSFVTNSPIDWQAYWLNRCFAWYVATSESKIGEDSSLFLDLLKLRWYFFSFFYFGLSLSNCLLIIDLLKDLDWSVECLVIDFGLEQDRLRYYL